MSRNRRGHRSQKSGEQIKEALDNINESNPVLMMFKDFSISLDEKHDRYERIVKQSRDITIESKRIIFLLHNRDTEIETKCEKIFLDAKHRLDTIIEKQFKAIALELEGFDSYQYLRAYTGGMQEFIEALFFYQYLKHDKIDNWSKISELFLYKVETKNELTDEITVRDVTLLFPQAELVLGLADFTGELMRKCINSLAAGNVDDCFKTCKFVKIILASFLGVNLVGKEIGRKIYVLKQSLNKMEMVCYNIKVRGSEVPKHMLAIVATSSVDDVDLDEGFY